MRNAVIKIYDYQGYEVKFLLKKDLTPKKLSRYGIKTNRTMIETSYQDCAFGYVKLVDYDYKGVKHVRHCRTYSIEKMQKKMNLG